MREWNDTTVPLLVINDQTRHLPKEKRPPYVSGWRLGEDGVYYRQLADGRFVASKPEKWAIMHVTEVGLYRKEEPKR